ncbi:MAG: ATP-binding protein [Chloroflexota bacterium]|nr:ATP-binding protein [Chloroflexota bacterium]
MTYKICADFVGREQELRRIAEFLKTGVPKGLSFLGLPGIGRSRLLREIEERAAPQRSQDAYGYGANVCVVRIECKERTEVIRWSELLDLIANRVCTRFEKRAAVSRLTGEYENAIWTDSPTAEGADAKTWSGFFKDLEITAPEFRVVFLLDDFDKSEPRERPRSGSQAEWVTGWHFTEFITYSNVCLITTSTHNIHQVKDFFTYFTEQWLSPFTREDMDDLVQVNVLRPSPRLRDAVWRWTGGFPSLECKLLGCYHTASAKLTRATRNTWLRDDVEPWFDQIWGLLHPFEQQLLADLARRRRLTLRYKKEKDVAERLEQKGLASLDGEWAQLAFEAPRKLVLRKVTVEKWWHFTGEKLFRLSIWAMIFSSILVFVFSLVEVEPAWGVLPMLLLIAYAIYGLFAPRYENA